jgi:hypothetical protein
MAGFPEKETGMMTAQLRVSRWAKTPLQLSKWKK